MKRRFTAVVVVSNAWSLTAFVLVWSATGCVSIPALPPVDLHGPGWSATESPALWRPNGNAPELTGELLVAVHPNGNRLVQFSKQGLPVVTARLSPYGWEVTSTLASGKHSGSPPPPSRLVWFHVDGSPPRSQPSKPWQLTMDRSAGRWTLLNPQTGESLQAVIE